MIKSKVFVLFYENRLFYITAQSSLEQTAMEYNPNLVATLETKDYIKREKYYQEYFKQKYLKTAEKI